jgi:hypothetical protein
MMITGSTRVIPNTVWKLDHAGNDWSNFYDRMPAPAKMSGMCMTELDERALRAQLSERLAKLCNYSGKLAQR